MILQQTYDTKFALKTNLIYSHAASEYLRIRFLLNTFCNMHNISLGKKITIVSKENT